MKVFGNIEFCECISEASPIGIDFIGYVKIVAGTKDEFNYDQLSSDDKELFDATRASRDKCVSWEGKKMPGAAAPPLIQDTATSTVSKPH